MKVEEMLRHLIYDFIIHTGDFALHSNVWNKNGLNTYKQDFSNSKPQFQITRKTQISPKKLISPTCTTELAEACFSTSGPQVTNAIFIFFQLNLAGVDA